MTSANADLPQHSALTKALSHSRVSSGRATDQAAFARSIKTGVAEAGAHQAIADHLNEADENELADLVAEGYATFESLERLASQVLEEDHPNAAYLRDSVK